MSRLGYQSIWDNGHPHFRGRAGVLLEFAPNQYAQYVMHVHESRIDLEREVGTVSDDYLSRIVMPTSTRICMVLEGTLTSLDQMHERPAWATARPEIEARRELEERR